MQSRTVVLGALIQVVVVVMVLLALPLLGAGTPEIRVTRFETNPLITTGTPGAGSNICGPSVIRVPEWVEKPLGAYYMYFARHSSSSLDGAHIRLAYADSPMGPWKIHKPGTLKRSQLKDVERDRAAGRKVHTKQHIASPDVHVDHEKRRIVLYFHGRYFGHNTGAATSPDGIHFEDVDVNLGRAYLRVFKHKGQYYGLSQGGPMGKGPKENPFTGAALLRKFDGPFKVSDEGGIDIIPPEGKAHVRHLALLHQADRLIVFYSRTGDTPERILASVIELKGDWKTWTASAPVEVLRPEFPYEGSELPLTTSKGGTGRNKRELRDPCVFVDDDGAAYLYYTIKGECGVAGARLNID